MSFLDADSFTFDGQNSDSYNLMMCWIDETANVSANGLRRSINSGETNHVRLKTNNYGVSFDGNIEFSFYVIKRDETPFTRQESMAVNRWLTGSSVPRALYFNDNAVPSLHYYAVCTEIEDKVILEHQAKKLVFKTNSPFGFTDPVEKRFLVAGGEVFSIDNLADTVSGIFYPRILLSARAADAVVIENMSDRKSVTFRLGLVPPDDSGNRSILVDSAQMKLLDLNDGSRLIPFHEVGWTTQYSSYVSSIDSYMESIYWFRLIRGTNTIRITGDCEVTFIFEFPRKAGCL
ncbi:MAG: hypothetical protein K2M20_12465 [Lachnospiraceae bacterium]|nr:hypothetical protein [Lachnospiraceae bacterium]